MCANSAWTWWSGKRLRVPERSFKNFILFWNVYTQACVGVFMRCLAFIQKFTRGRGQSIEETTLLVDWVGRAGGKSEGGTILLGYVIVKCWFLNWRLPLMSHATSDRKEEVDHVVGCMSQWQSEATRNSTRYAVTCSCWCFGPGCLSSPLPNQIKNNHW